MAILSTKKNMEARKTVKLISVNISSTEVCLVTPCHQIQANSHIQLSVIISYCAYRLNPGKHQF